MSVYPRRIAAMVAATIALAAPAVAGVRSDAGIATGRPTPIGQVSHEVSPIGYTYKTAPGAVWAPIPAPRHARHRPLTASRTATASARTAESASAR